MAPLGKNKEQKEIERQVKFRQGLSRVRGFVARSRETQRQLWDLGKRAYQLGDRSQFSNIAKAYLRTGDIINRWERYLVSAQTLEVQRGQVRATGDFLQSINALSQSMMAGAQTKDIVKMRVDVEQALARAQNLDETLTVVMDAANDSIFASEGISEQEIAEVTKAMGAEAAHQEESESDGRIDEGLKRIEALMKKELGET